MKTKISMQTYYVLIRYGNMSAYVCVGGWITECVCAWMYVNGGWICICLSVLELHFVNHATSVFLRTSTAVPATHCIMLQRPKLSL